MQNAFLKLKQDVSALEKDWEELLLDKKLSRDHHFLEKIAHDIKELNEDSELLEHFKPYEDQAEMIHYMLTTPWGAPFVSEKTLIEAALAYQFQEPSHSDLAKMMKEFTEHSEISHNQFLTVLHSLSRELKASKDKLG